MYGYQDYTNVTPEQLLQKITQEQIFEFVLEQPFNINDRYLSPFRKDTKPGCRFAEREDGTIVFIDFGEKLINPSKTHRSCFGMVMDRYNVTIDGAVRLLCIQFGLSKDATDYESVTINTTAYARSEDKDYADIQFDKIPFAKRDVIYWSQFIIRPEHLKEDRVYATNRFSIKKTNTFKTINVYGHCYAIDFIDRVKIYQPYSEKYKWITNCNENNIGNIDNLPATGDELIIQKSYKDHRVLRNLNLGLNVIWFQNEGCVPSLEILKNLTERFTLITIFFDNDKDGIIAARKLLQVFNEIKPGCARMLYLPRRKFEWKDPGEFVKKEGRIDLIKVLKYIGL